MTNIKYQFIFSLIGLILFNTIRCSDDENGNDMMQSCSPVFDGNLQAFDRGCVEDENEHIKIEGLNIPQNETLALYALASSNTARDGIVITFKGGSTGSISIKHPENPEHIINGQNLTQNETWCIDLHKEEAPVHVLVWKGTSRCNGNANADNALFDSEGDPSPGNGPSAQWTGSESEDEHFNYQASSENVKAVNISAGEPLLEEE